MMAGRASTVSPAAAIATSTPVTPAMNPHTDANVKKTRRRIELLLRCRVADRAVYCGVPRDSDFRPTSCIVGAPPFLRTLKDTIVGSRLAD
jgi:hypothetical protein